MSQHGILTHPVDNIHTQILKKKKKKKGEQVHAPSECPSAFWKWTLYSRFNNDLPVCCRSYLPSLHLSLLHDIFFFVFPSITASACGAREVASRPVSGRSWDKRERESQHTRPARLKVKVGEKNLKQTREKRRRRKKKVYSKCRLLLCTSSTLRKDKGNLSLMTAGMPSISGQTTIFDSFDTGPDPKRQSLKPFSPVHLLLLFFFAGIFCFTFCVSHTTRSGAQLPLNDFGGGKKSSDAAEPDNLYAIRLKQ